jgi:hypothetical protein
MDGSELPVNQCVDKSMDRSGDADKWNNAEIEIGNRNSEKRKRLKTKT